MQEVEVKLTTVIAAREAKIVRIHRQPNEIVNRGDALFDLEGNKETATLYAQVSGKMVALEVAEGDVVPTGSVLARIEVGDEEVVSVGEGEEATIPEKEKPSFDYLGGLLRPQTEHVDTDIAILGAGPGGYVAAIQAAQLGASVVLIEKGKVGGTCLNWGCIPTKALVRSAEVYKTLRQSEEYGCYAGDLRLDMGRVISRKQQVVDQLVRGIHLLLRANRVELIEGVGSLNDQHTVSVRRGHREILISSRYIIIATGSRASNLPIPGMDIPNVLDSKKALELRDLPERMVIIGGGIIGMEFAFIFSNFGVKVSVVEYLDRILGGCDIDICQEMGRIARQQEIHIYTSAEADAIDQAEDGQCVVTFSQRQERKYLTAGKVLVAIGREPDLTGVDLGRLGIEPNDTGRGIKTNEYMQTNIPHIYAIGDVTDEIQLAHVASRQGIVAVRHILGQGITMDYSAVPSAIFTDPEIALVGLSEAEAKEKGIPIEVGRFPFMGNGKALTYGETRGFVKAIRHRDSGKMVGAAIVGPNATDLIAELTLAIQNGLTAEQVANTIHAHPTTTEAIHEAILATMGGAIHSAT